MMRGGRVWRTAHGAIVLDRPRIAGIINVTPDSFWDGGRHNDVKRAVDQAARLIDEGADLLDIGGESTRPGAEAVPASEETARTVPVIEAISRRWPDVPLSIDTVKADVARAALAAGAAAINDVSAMRLDPAMAEVAAQTGAGVILMHSRGRVSEMARYQTAVYGNDPEAEMVAELAAAADRALAGGVASDAIVVDPGLGFSKRTVHSVGALGALDRFLALGYPVMVGPSRKRFIGEIGGNGGGPLPAEERVEGTVGASIAALFGGAMLFRVHDVLPVRRALDVAWEVRKVAT
jgi:dihydropteroate synthase